MESDRTDDIVRDITDRLAAAWNVADGAAYGAPFAEDAAFVDIRGAYHRGRDAIARGHQAVIDNLYQDSRLAFTLLAARRLADDIILAHVRGDLRVPAGPLAGEQGAVATLVLARDGETWRIAAFHNTRVEVAR